MKEIRHERSVHPLVTASIVSFANRHHVAIAAHDDVRRAVNTGTPLVEARHTSFLAALHQNGRPWSAFDAGFDLGRTGTHPLIEFLGTSRDAQELWQRSLRLEPLLHLGNRTRTEQLRNGFQVQHEQLLGSPPSIPESMFVAGAQCGLLLRIGVQRSRVVLRAGTTTFSALPLSRRAVHHPDARWGPIDGWTINWSSAPVHEGPRAPTGPPSFSEQALALVADRPEAPWTLAALADAIGVSRRTLQRRVQEEGTTVKLQIVMGRINAGLALLTRTDLPLSVIAVGCGFADGPHFSNSCRRFNGATPSDLRRSGIAAV